MIEGDERGRDDLVDEDQKIKKSKRWKMTMSMMKMVLKFWLLM